MMSVATKTEVYIYAHEDALKLKLNANYFLSND